MTGITELKAYHQAYKKALEIHFQWSDKDESELLKQCNELRELVNPVLEVAGDGWPRHQNLKRHLSVMKANLETGKKDTSTCDINDLIYADLPALADHLFRLASH
ncbi:MULTISPECIES: hypothetical protein [unclassified Pseudomonas]|uniref:hypothetical protein n=1 Tax=unclassified Pseudomonas TaxID=196821 RepID=UPI000BA366D6|nr:MULTISPECIES: hypothetical protein [unclassified Pseudomonas]